MLPRFTEITRRARLNSFFPSLRFVQEVVGFRHYASYSEYSRANSYPWSAFHPRLARPGPGPHTRPVVQI